MSKNYLMFFILFLVFLSANVRVQATELRNRLESYPVDWEHITYAPDLYLQPYFKFHFKTVLNNVNCSFQNFPFWEGFNTNSPTIHCWISKDANDINNPNPLSIWMPFNYMPYEGDQTMGYAGDANSDNWLISPIFKLDSTKVYKLSYYYLSLTSQNGRLEVLASNSGTDLTDFTNVVVPSALYNNSVWLKETAYIANFGGDVNLAWRVTSLDYTYLFIDHVYLEELACMEPLNLNIKNVKADEVTIFWDDVSNSSWEYYVQDADTGTPSGAGTTTTSTEVVVTVDANNQNLQTNRQYEYYLRAQCANGDFGEWVGPFEFYTVCTPLSLPFSEGFNSSSTTSGCWIVVDRNQDRLPSGNNAWRLHNVGQMEGDGAMYFRGAAAAGTHDDWLISPTVKMTGGLYAITYHYRTVANVAYPSEFEVLLSENGLAPSSFTTVLEAAKPRNNDHYLKKILYVQNITGDVNIAWHVVAQGTSRVFIDLVTIEEIDCIPPDEDVIVSDVEKDQATFAWTDSNNTDWEYFVRDSGGSGTPIGSGAVANSKSVTVNRTNGVGAVKLEPDTWYDFFVRSSCGAGKASSWVGPIAFKTSCEVIPLPFWEGFNSDSNTLSCWSIIDNNNDKDPQSYNIWKSSQLDPFEGDQIMAFDGLEVATKHDDWLISPTFTMDSTKYYRLKYHYRSFTPYKTDFDVLLSTTGNQPADFIIPVLSKRQYSHDDWVQELVFITGVHGNVNLAWHVNTVQNINFLHIDNVYFEEIIGCPEPLNSRIEQIKEDRVDLVWDDDYGNSWEYFIQFAGGTVPTTNGVVTTSKLNTVTTEQAGNNLEANTAYEYYVRTVCSNGDYSVWSGPFAFRTDCRIFTVPFWEGFNANSAHLECWKIRDRDGNLSLPVRTVDQEFNLWHPYIVNAYEGSHAMHFFKYEEDIDSNDWLISPVFEFEQNKIYRLKYHQSMVNYGGNSRMTVLASNQGIENADFTKQIVSGQISGGTYRERVAFIKDFYGSVNLAWRITGRGVKAYHLDHVFVEEVIGCPEPLSLRVDDVGIDKATLKWSDGMGATSWEYYLQEEGLGVPLTNGTAITEKEIALTADHSGMLIKSNTQYEFYVRTDCGNGEHSIWSGPFKFWTPCDILPIPFYEGFNTDSKTVRCWSFTDKSGRNSAVENKLIKIADNINIDIDIFEGDRAVYLLSHCGSDRLCDEWLISPTLAMTAGNYVLKYHYKTSTRGGDQIDGFEVLLSTDGSDRADFNTVLVPSKTYALDNYTEQVVFMDSIQANVNIAWHIDVNPSFSSVVYLDNIQIKKIENCREPYYVTTTNHTNSSMDVSWQQDGIVTHWEVVVVKYGDDINATPVQTHTVTGNPKITLSGLNPSSSYTVFVRARCADGQSNSDWGTPHHAGTLIGLNDDCQGAVNIPVNPTLECVQTVSASMIGATLSNAVLPSCGIIPPLENDVWFEFIATEILHLLTVKDVLSVSGATVPEVYGVLYEENCTQITTESMTCFSFARDESEQILTGLTPGKKYYLRFGSEAAIADFVFNLCITTPQSLPLEVIPSGGQYSIEYLVEEVLVNADCDLVSNVNYQNGDGSARTQQYNTIGYFNKQNSVFPFDEGIVLSTNEIEYVGRPYLGYDEFRGNNDERWIGDRDINDAIYNAGGGPKPIKRVTQLEFDFISIKDSIHFEYLFASNSYHRACGDVCNVGAMFAAWLVDTTTGEGRNLAKVPEVDMPISINTVRDVSKSGAGCRSVNPEWYWKHYENDQDSPIEAPVDFVGFTKPMKSETVAVVIGRKYHIKLAVIDFCPTPGHSSAVFFNSGSFNLGQLDLGVDLLVETNNALCHDESRWIESGLSATEFDIQWYKDDVAIAGATTPNYEVVETGTYKVVGEFDGIDCEVEGSIRVEIFPAISAVVIAPNTLEICRQFLAPLTVDLTSVEKDMLVDVDPSHYEVNYYTSEKDAEEGENPIENPLAFQIEVEGRDVPIFIHIEDLRTGCTEIFPWTLKAVAGTKPVARADDKFCGSYTLPELDVDQYYYSQSRASGFSYEVGEVLTAVGEHQIFVLQDNGGNCFEEVSYKVTITEPVFAAVFDDQVLECELYTLKKLPANNRYFTKPQGQGQELIAGTDLLVAQTVYIYAASDDQVCVDESSFTIAYNDCPIPKGISPNGDSYNDRFDLSKHGISAIKIYNRYGSEVYSYEGAYTNQWYGQNKKGKMLPDGTYYYVVNAHGKTRTGWVQINR